MKETFYSNAPEQGENASLKEKVASYEKELAVLRKSLSEREGKGTQATEDENLRLKAELDKANKALINQTGTAGQAREAALEKREAEIAEKERALAAGRADDQELEKRYRAELNEKEAEARRREADLTAKVEALEKELRSKGIEDQLREDELKLAKMSKSEAIKAIDERMRGVKEKEKQILELQETVDELHQVLRERDDELKGLKEILSYKEEELTRREEDLMYREKKVTEERRQLEDAKKTTSGLEEADLKKRLEEMRAEVDKKEREIRSKEEYLRSKEAELKRREQGVIEEDLKNKDEELVQEVQQAKVKTGNLRLDDLLLGGIPFGSNVLVYGPPFVGKETMVNQFISEGLKKGIPAIWVTTDKAPADLREEMRQVLPEYEDYEALGLVRYVDSYSKSMGAPAQDQYTIYVDEPTSHDQIMDAVEKIAKEYKEKHEYYRLAFRTISTLIAYSDPNTAFRFLNPFCGRRKRDRAVSMYTIEKGMHGEQEIQMLGSIMDGMVDFKVEQLRTYFMVRGITDVQSRSYIRYDATRHGLSIGSFALDHIK